MLHAIWKGASLRSWIAVGMATAILPLAVSGAAGYLLLSHGVVASLQDIAQRQRSEIDPVQRLRLLLLEAQTPLDDFVDEGDALQPGAYRVLRERIEAMFADVHNQVRKEPEITTMIERARDDWTAADRIAAEALSVRRAPGDPAEATRMDRFHGLINTAEDKLGVAYVDLEKDLRLDHDQALQDVERSDRIALAAAILSFIAVLGGVVMIGRVMTASVERLVSGAELFAAGDRDHRIEISLPPELHRVAEEFNRMIGRIHESEGALADLARRDGLTLLLNRRAFDEELAEMLARQQRFGEPFALLAVDLDRFKTINDTHGHGVGDDVLRATARTLAASVRPFDAVFRIGGEEFAAILSRSDEQAARVTAERLRQAISAEPIPAGGTAVTVTASIGIAVAVPGTDAARLVEAADAALYQAKSGGRNRVVVNGEVQGSPRHLS